MKYEFYIIESSQRKTIDFFSIDFFFNKRIFHELHYSTTCEFSDVPRGKIRQVLSSSRATAAGRLTGWSLYSISILRSRLAVASAPLVFFSRGGGGGDDDDDDTIAPRLDCSLRWRRRFITHCVHYSRRFALIIGFFEIIISHSFFINKKKAG